MTVEARHDDVVLPRRLAAVLRPELAGTANEIVDEIRAAIPSYAGPIDGPYGAAIRAGVQQATSLFVEQIANPEVSAQQCYDVHRKLGQYEMREGRSLDALQAAYRIGARVAWRRIMRVGSRHGFSSTVMSQLADAIFSFMDRLAAAALDGYLEAKALSADAMDSWRRRLLGLIMEIPQASAQAIAELAQLVDWTVPAEAAPVAVQPLTPHPQRSPLLDRDILAELDGVEPHLLVPGQPTGDRVAAIRAALPDYRISFGPSVALASVTDSLRWARKALTLDTSTQVLLCEERLWTLLVHSDERLLAELSRRALAPLRGMTAKQRERTLDTLRAWLDTLGSVPDMAERLNLHPQTVRYRLRQLETMFGDRLHVPSRRFELELALRAR
jgi:PucR C-terminal helix-turn-helix domain